MNMELLLPDETMSRLDRMGSDFLEKSDAISNDEAFEILADLLSVSQESLGQYFLGCKFVPNPEDVEEE